MPEITKSRTPISVYPRSQKQSDIIDRAIKHINDDPNSLRVISRSTFCLEAALEKAVATLEQKAAA